VVSCRVGYEEALLGVGAGAGGEQPSAGRSGNTGAGGAGSSAAGNHDPGGTDGNDAGAASAAGSSGTLGGAAGEGPAAEGGAGASSGSGGSGGVPDCQPTAECSCEERQGHAYWFCTTALTWTQAEAHCETAGMQLVRVDSQAENDFLVDRGTASGVFDLNGFAQIGANDQAVPGEWRWVDGTQLWSGDATGSAVNGAFSNWLMGSPSVGGVKNCAGILLLGTWQERSCTAVVPFICESP
jgi:hypothetical protein